MRETGFKTKPLWIYGVAILFLVSPFVHIMWTIRGLGEIHWWNPSSWVRWIPHLNLAPAFLAAILFSSGISLLFVRRWSWTFSMISLSLIGIYNITVIAQQPQQDLLTLILLSVSTVVFLSILFRSEFKKPYLNSALRWWESMPRYQLNQLVKIKDQKQSWLLIDISKTGLHLKPSTGQPLEKLPNEIEIQINESLNIRCKHVRDTLDGYAFSIIGPSLSTKKALRSWLNEVTSDSSKKIR